MENNSDSLFFIYEVKRIQFLTVCIYWGDGGCTCHCVSVGGGQGTICGS